MAGGMKIDWHGVEQLTMTIKGAGSKVRDQSGKVIKNKTEKLKKKAQELAPKDTEFLKDHIKSSYPDQLEGHVKGEAAYEGYQEYGTRFQPGKPHIRPALREIEPEFKREMTDVMKGVFED
ncbi:HK97-gp10 family putative phage morphogenesis protein [Streptococcus danieliae]|nr:HK97-gp10 family putative phage morphogenesis protein [Streptococcus danieliae]